MDSPVKALPSRMRSVHLSRCEDHSQWHRQLARLRVPLVCCGFLLLVSRLYAKSSVERRTGSMELFEWRYLCW